MILVLFEATIKKDRLEDYRSLVAGLNDELAGAAGYIRSENFSSPTCEGKLLSVMLWESEQAVEKWRNVAEHRLSQRQGRDLLFENYAITVAEKIRTYSETDRAEAPEDSERFFARPGQ